MAGDRPEAAPLHRQVEYLEAVLARNTTLQGVLAVAGELALPDWYLGAGGIAQTVWNVRHGYEPEGGIKDYDLVYFDPGDLSAESEARHEELVTERLRDDGVALADGVRIDVKNQARVHLWYARRFGRELSPYLSTEDAIATWPTTASSVGVRRDGSDLVVCAPFGLSDLLGMVARPNKALVSREVYEEKTARWAARWPGLTVIPW